MNYFLIVMAAAVVPMIVVLLVALQRTDRETLLVCDYPRELTRRIIDIAIANVQEMHPRFQFDSMKANGVVLRVRLDWRPWFVERITISAEEKAIRVVSEGFSRRRDNLEIVREKLTRALDWARNRSPEEISAEGLKSAFPGLASHRFNGEAG
jgi:hypothetical protein